MEGQGSEFGCSLVLSAQTSTNSLDLKNVKQEQQRTVPPPSNPASAVTNGLQVWSGARQSQGETQ